MRYVLIVLGIAVAAVVLSMLVTKPKDLTPDPMEREWARREAQEKQKTPKADRAPEPFNPPREGVRTAVLGFQSLGELEMELYPKAAPKTVARFMRLIDSGFYKGILVHRVEPGFVVQMGDPKTKTAGLSDPTISQNGSGQNIPFEKNGLKHVAFTVSMALSSPQSDTADSQFFINLGNNHQLDGDYCVFGRVTKGIDVLDKIQPGDRVERFELKP